MNLQVEQKESLWIWIWKQSFKWVIKKSKSATESESSSDKRWKKDGTHSKRDTKKVPRTRFHTTQTSMACQRITRKPRIYQWSLKKTAIIHSPEILPKYIQTTPRLELLNWNQETKQKCSKNTTHNMKTKLTQRKERLWITKTCLHRCLKMKLRVNRNNSKTCNLRSKWNSTSTHSSLLCKLQTSLDQESRRTKSKEWRHNLRWIMEMAFLQRSTSKEAFQNRR